MLVEPVSGPKPYPLRTAADAVAVVDRVAAAGAANVGFLCDLYHLAINGDDVDAAIAAYADRIAHVQIADAPGRGEPGTRRARPRPATWPTWQAAATPAGSAWSTSPTGRRPRTASAWLPRATARAGLTPARRRPASTKESCMTTDRLHRPRHHGRPDGRQPGQGRLRRRRLQPQPGQGRARWSRPAAGAPTASPRRSRDADVVATMVPDSPDVQEVLAGEGGVFANAKPGTLIIDFSTIRPDVAAELAERRRERAASGCSTPRSSGGEAGAIEGTLSIMVGGDAGGLRRRPAGARRGRARPSCTSGPPAPARPSRPPTS